MALYPPIVASSMPAFAGSEVRIYFTLSNYNNADDIAEVQATVRRQSNNVNVLKSDSEIRSFSFNGLSVQKDDTIFNRYYITLKSGDLINGFETDTIYKVQLRLSSVKNPGNSISFFTDNLSYFSLWSTVCIIKKINPPRFYIDEFTVEDLRDQLIDIALLSVNYYYNTFADFNIIYKSVYKAANSNIASVESLTLNKYKILLFDLLNNLLADSGDILSSAYNYTVNTNSLVISCSLPYLFKDNTDYKVRLTIETRNGYVESKTYDFTTQFEVYDPLEAVMYAAVNEEEGYIKLQVDLLESYVGNLVIRRSDAKGNFLNWRDIKHFLGIGLLNQSFTYYDFTAESGMIYKYLIQKRDRHGKRGTPTFASYRYGEYGNDFDRVSGIMGLWSHAFLLLSNNGNISETKQLKLAFDFQLSTYKYNILESKTDTLGSKYPFIKRNGDNYYRSFGCSGTITGYMDLAELLTSKDELYYGQTEIYNKLKGDIDNYSKTYDYTYERKFREKVELFLYNSKPKLYKSMQEGNMLIKLMDISLTPKNELGRLIYTFSATGYEIDDNDILTLIKYDFIKPGVYNTELRNEIDTIGRISGYIDSNSYSDLDHPILNKFPANFDILGTDLSGNGAVIASAAGSIALKINYMQSFNNKIVNDFTIDWLRITIEDDPYLIVNGTNGYVPDDGTLSQSYVTKYLTRKANLEKEIAQETSPGVIRILTRRLEELNKKYLKNSTLYFFKLRPNVNDTYIGTLIYFNDSPIIIAPPNNVYLFSDIKITKNDHIRFAKDTAAIIDYHITYNEILDKTGEPTKIRFDRVNGCLLGVYKNFDIVNTLIAKYRFSNELTRKTTDQRIERVLNEVNTISIDTLPGTIVSIKTNQMDEYADFTVGFTGLLKIDFLRLVGTNIVSYIIKGKDGEPVEALVYYCASVRREYY